MARTSEPVAWLSLIDVSGPFLVGAVLEQAFPQGLEKIETPRRQRLRAAYDEWQDAVEELDQQLPALHDAWVRMVLEDCLEYDSESLTTKAGLAGSIVCRPQEHAIEYAPDFAVRGGDGAPRLLIAIYPPETNLENPLPQETWPASPAERMVLLCRANQCRVGLVTNGEQWMLVNAPVGETSGYASWYARFWWQEPVTFKAFQSLLGVRRCFGPEKDTLPRLLERSLDFQEEVTNTLGEQVRRAVEVLIQALGRADQDRNGELLKEIAPAELYEAGLTVMMRLVFLLSAEERGLLLLGDPLYDQHYAVSTLRAKLHEDADQHGVEVLERRHDAWSRLLATFRGIFGGIEHEALRLPALGGSLFDPDRFPFLEGRAPKTKWRAQPAIPLPIDNRTVLLLLTALQILKQKGGAQLLSYRALDVEQIGHVYEGLLEFTAARVSEITLGLIGTKKIPNPQITLSELDSITAKGEDALLEHLKELTGRSLPALGKALKAEESREMLVRLVQASNGDETLARRLLPFGELIRADSWGNLLVYRQGSFAIVKGTDRRSSGTHYTPRSLTEPIVRYTLEPLVYVGPADGHPQPEWKLKSSADILTLNVCDMACGSGAFLVEACRYLSLRLVEAWANEEARGLQIGIDGIARGTLGEYEPLPKPLDDRLLVSRRLVAQSCLYGVDINHLAVELAKLAIWLVTLAKNKPFSFLDHALRCGDSLVGLHDLEQLRFFSLKPDTENPVLFKGPLNTAVDESIELRLKLEGKPADTVADVEAQGRLLAQAEDDVARLKCSADLLVAAEFWGEGNADKLERTHQASVKSAYYVDKGPTEEFQQVAVKERRGQKMFHWPLEFPEVIVKRGGFDAFMGNPPFMGGKKITGNLGTEYRSYAVEHLANGSKGNADLCSYFLLRSGRLLRTGGHGGFLTTNSIAQGDSRIVGLDGLLSQGCAFTRATPTRTWPGVATLEIAELWFGKHEWAGVCFLNGLPVHAIDSFLSVPLSIAAEPKALAANRSKCFQGTIVLGTGFVIPAQEARSLIAKSPKNAEVLFPYLNGSELNARVDDAPERWIINFFDWYLDASSAPLNHDGPIAADYPECLDIVREKVKPQRDELGLKKDATAQGYARLWWQYGRRSVDLYNSIRALSRVLVKAQVSKTWAWTFLPNGWVYDAKLIVAAFDDFASFAVLQSTLHWEWSIYFGTTLRLDMSYTPTTNFDPFPFPAASGSLRDVGARYYELRSDLMRRKQEGLTPTYNQFHDPDETSADIQKLRDLHVELDQVVAAAYGWTDLELGNGFHETKQGVRFTISETARREALQRLLKLNHERYEEETRQAPHTKTKGSRGRKKQKTDPGDLPLLGMEEAEMPSPYKMTVDLNVLDHLGINLYSNIAAVVTEAVANAWDADASVVDIRFNSDSSVIEIQDDGIGMSVPDMNKKYLRVGYRRRDDSSVGTVTAKGRPVMGRKGLGKLSLFSIAEIIEVHSANSGKKHGLRMTVEGIRQSVKKQASLYVPDELSTKEVKISKGTLLRLKKIKKQRLGRSVEALRKRLARRFSVIGKSHSFQIKIDGKPVTVEDRGDLSVCQFVWHFGKNLPDGAKKSSIKEHQALPQRMSSWDSDWSVSGWIGTSQLPKQLDNEDAGNLNSIVVFARGRLFHENILDKLNDGRLYTKYLTGQIEADFLDSDAEPDIATSDRQRVQEDDPRYVALLAFLKRQTTKIEKQWTEWRRKHEVQRAKETIPALDMWLKTLQSGFRDSAEELISKISALPIEREDDRRELYKHGIMAFERMKLRGSTEKLVASIDNLEKVLKLLADRDALEASMYRDIVKSRVDAIQQFQKLVDAEAKERVLQKYLFDHLWLLDPSWERATGSEIMETRLIQEGVIVAELSKKEKLGRVDIAYRTMAGKHIIVELKRADRQMKLLELQEQGQTYVDKIRKILLKQGEKTPNIEVIFVIGQPIAEEASNPERLKSSMAAVSPGSRIIHYDTLIKSAQESYADYLKRSKELDKLEQILEKLYE